MKNTTSLEWVEPESEFTILTNAIEKYELDSLYVLFSGGKDSVCVAFAEPWDLKLMEKFDPLAYNTIRWYEQQIGIRGSDKAKKYNRWGMKQSSDSIAEQQTFDSFLTDGNQTFEVNDDYCGESCAI